MKAQSIPPQRSAEAHPPSRGPARPAADGPPDLFALLLSAAEGDEPALQPPPAGVPAAKPSVAKLPDSKLPDAKSKDVRAEPMGLALETAETTELGTLDGKPPDLLAGLVGLPGLSTAATLAHRRMEPTAEPAGPGQWVSTVAKGRPRTAPDVLGEPVHVRQEPLALGQGLSAEPLRSAWHGSHAAGLAGSLTGGAQGEPQALGLTGLEGAWSEQTGTPQDQQPGQQRGESPRVLLESAASARSGVESSPTERSFADALGDAMGSGMEQALRELGDQVSLWATGQTRKASLLLETGLRQALEVDVSLNGDQAQLVFRTDDAAARDAIKAHAYDLLNDMLQRAGMGLESLSVGGRDAGGQSGASLPDEGRGAQGRQDVQTDNAPPEVALHLKTWQGAGLSVYA